MCFFRPIATTAPTVTTLEAPASALLRKRARSPSQKGDANENTISPEVKRRSKELDSSAVPSVTAVTSTVAPTTTSAINPNVMIYSYPQYLHQ